MTKNERNQLRRELAKLIQQSPPILRDDADLLEYRDHVETILHLNRWEENAVLLQAKMLADPKFAAAMAKKQAKHWKGVNHRLSLPKKGTAARQKQGAQTQGAVVKAWHSVSNLPKRNRASIIAKRCKLTGRAVRIHLKSAGLI